MSQLRPVGVREGFLEEVIVDLGLKGEVGVKEGDEIKEKAISVENTAHAKAWIRSIRLTQ